MRNRNVFIQIFILLLIKVSHIRSNCTWVPDPQTTCSLTCGSERAVPLENVAATMANLNKEWTEAQTKYPDCVVDGIYLQLENISYPADTLKPNIFLNHVKMRELTIKLNLNIRNQKTADIEVNAFRTDGLKSLKKLEISNVMSTPFRKGTFNGLDDLEVLRISGRRLSTFEAGILDGLNVTLKEFSLQEAEKWLDRPINEIWINGLTGSVAMEKLETVRIKYNLKTSIDSATFVGLTNVKTLDLSDCQIESIPVGSFDMMDYLEVLKLDNNKIATIPDGLFSRILIRNATQIFLEGNGFLCDCTLKPFKLSLMEYSNFVGELICAKPEMYRNHKILITTFYDHSCVVPTTTTTTTSTTSTISTTPSPTTTRKCMSPDGSETTLIDALAIHRIQINEIGSDDIILQAGDELSENSVLIWFSLLTDPATNVTLNGNTNCLIASGPTFRIDNLVEDLAYTICLMDRLETTVSPLDCISYIKRSESVHPWLLHESKGRIIGIALVTCAVSTLIGLAIGSFPYKLRMWRRDRRECLISYKSSRVSSMRRRTSPTTSDSFLTRRTSNATVQHSLNVNYNAPPLPARPVSISVMNEPVYDTVRF